MLVDNSRGISEKIVGSRAELGLDFSYVNVCSFSGFLLFLSVDNARWLIARVDFTVRF